jgi:gentisate 1,2-dioxygenase
MLLSSILLGVLTSIAVSRILGGSALRISPGKTSPPIRETASSVFHVISGTGSSTIGDQHFTWKQGDTFCVPSWYKYSHAADAGPEPVYLYRFHDKPMLISLGFYRVEGMDLEGLVSD